MGRTAGVAALTLVALTCATTHHYARRPEAERSGHVFASAVRTEMTLQDVVRTLAECRLPGQLASLSSEVPSGDSIRIVLHSGELLGAAGHTKMFAAGYASLELYHRADTRLESHGFERQRPLLADVAGRQADLSRFSRYLASFDATVEGGCGQSTVAVSFDDAGRVSEVGRVEEGSCGP
jgi:hypothetical protein